MSKLTGLTTTGCAKACNAECCIISGKPYCAHPSKGGLQSASMHDTDARDRLALARKMLGIDKLPPDVVAAAAQQAAEAAP